MAVATMKLQTAVGRFVLFLRSVANRTRKTGLARTAGSLAFTTVLGLVPLATVALSFVARFPVFQQWLDAFEAFLLQYTLPGSANEVVHRYVREFTEKAVGLTGVSILFIAVAATLVIAQVEREINAFWGVGAKRPFAQRLTVYVLGITVGPVLVGASISVTTWLVSQTLAPMATGSTLSRLVVKPLPFVLSTLALAFLYVIAPARRVPLVNAFAGALPAALGVRSGKVRLRDLREERAHVRSRLRHAGRVAGVPHLDLCVLADRAGGSRDHRDPDARRQ